MHYICVHMYTRGEGMALRKRAGGRNYQGAGGRVAGLHVRLHQRPVLPCGTTRGCAGQSREAGGTRATRSVAGARNARNARNARDYINIIIFLQII